MLFKHRKTYCHTELDSNYPDLHIWQEDEPYSLLRKPRGVDWGCIQARPLKHKQVGWGLRRVKIRVSKRKEGEHDQKPSQPT